MRSGINFHESPYAGSPLERLNTSRGDWTAIALGEPMNAAPGELWQYNGGGVIALAAAVQKAIGVRFVDYARQKLFAPLGITSQFWFVSPFDSLPHTGGGLNLKAMDLARIGYLVLRHGSWNGTQVVPASWIEESTRVHTQRPRTLGGYGTDYGYLWWLMPAGEGDTGGHDDHRVRQPESVDVRRAAPRPRGRGHRRREPGIGARLRDPRDTAFGASRLIRASSTCSGVSVEPRKALTQGTQGTQGFSVCWAP